MSQNRQFSILLIIIALLILYLIDINSFSATFNILIYLILILNLIFPNNIFNVELKNLWMKLGYLFHLSFSFIILIFIYFFVITPISFCMKLFKYNPLSLNTPPKWNNRDKIHNINFNDLF